MSSDALARLARVAPTPLARLAERAQNECSPEREHHNTYYVFELWLRLTSAVVAANYFARGERYPDVDEPIKSLVQLSIGNHLNFVRAYVRRFGSEPLASAWNQRISAEMAPAYAWACKHTTVQARTEATVADLSEALIAYRNKNIGHGGLHPPVFYSEASIALFPGICQLVAMASEQVGDHLFAVEGIVEDISGRRSGVVFELHGSLKTRLQAAVPESELDGMMQGHVYARRGSAPAAPLFPWVIWDQDFVYVLNGATKSAVEYLNYYTGEVIRRADPHLASLRALLGATETSFPLRTDLAPRTGKWVGDYEVVSALGRGAMGTVYLARQHSTALPVALKVLPEPLGSDPTALARFQREVDILKRCEHPNLVSLLDAGESNGTRFYAMELVNGCSLAELYAILANAPRDSRGGLSTGHLRAAIREALESHPTLPGEPASLREPHGEALWEQRASAVQRVLSFAERAEQELWRLLVLRFAEVADALGVLHERGVIHRDIKPSNIMLTEDASRAVVMDLGIAKTVNGSVHTKSGSFLGTLRYASREQIIRSLDDLSFRSDLYSLGATMYELFTLSPLFAEDETTARSESEGAVLKKVLDARPVPACERNPNLSPEIGVILEKLLEKEPDRRFYSSAAELAEDLRCVYAQKPIRARQYTPDERRAFELYDSLKALAATWDGERRPHDLLWGPERVSELVASEVERRFQLSDIERAFYDASKERADETQRLAAERAGREARMASDLSHEKEQVRRQRQRIRRFIVASAIVVLVVLVASARFSLSRVRQERDESRERERAALAANTKLAESDKYLSKALLAEQDNRWDEALIYYSYALAGTDTAAAREGIAREATLNVRTSLRWRASTPRSTIEGLNYCGQDRLLATSTGQPITLVASSTGAPLQGPLLGSQAAASGACSATGSVVAIGMVDGSVEVVDGRTWSHVRRLEGSAATASSLAMSRVGDLVVAGSDDGTARVWMAPEWKAVGLDTSTMTPRGVRDGAAAVGINAIAISADGTRVALAGDNGRIFVFERTSSGSWRRVADWVGHSGAVYGLSFVGASAHELLSGAADHSVKMWGQAESGFVEVHALHVRKDVYSVATSDDGSLFAFGSQDGYVHLWRTQAWAELRSTMSSREGINALSFSPDGTELAAAGEDASLEVRDVLATATDRLQSPLRGHVDGVEGLDFARSDVLASSGEDDTVRLWNLSTGTSKVLPSRGVGPALSISGDGSSLVTGDADGNLTKRDLPTGTSLGLDARARRITTVDLRPTDESLVAFGSKTGVVGLWLPAAGQSKSWRGHASWVNSAQFAPGGAWLASAGGEPYLCLWDVERLLRSETVPLPGDCAKFAGQAVDVDDLSFSVDGTQLASADFNGFVALWDLRTRTQVWRTRGHETAALAVSVSPRDPVVASGGQDGSIRIWSRSDGSEVRQLVGLSDAVYGVRFSSSGDILASAGGDGTVRLWNTRDWTEVGKDQALMTRPARQVLDDAHAKTGLCVAGGQAVPSVERCP